MNLKLAIKKLIARLASLLLPPNPAKPEPNKFQMFFSKLDQKKISANPLL
jgi:hypothetical protein